MTGIGAAGVERGECILLGLGHPNLLERTLGLRLRALGQLVQDIGGLVHPTATILPPYARRSKSIAYLTCEKSFFEHRWLRTRDERSLKRSRRKYLKGVASTARPFSPNASTIS
jgi:hypothetical protein